MNKSVAQPEIELPSIYLVVGEIYFGKYAKEVKTLLGSCVSVTLWQPRLKLGGMCHILLPEDKEDNMDDPNNTRYAAGAINWFLKHISNNKTRPSDYIVGLYGGGQMFSSVNNQFGTDIGGKNVKIVRELLAKHGFTIAHEDVSEPKYRNIVMDLSNGRVTIKATAVDETMG